MIKSRIIMLLVSCALTASVWGGGYFISKLQKPETEVTENNSKITNVDESNKDSDKDKDTSTKEEIENNKEDGNGFEKDNSVTSDSGNVENNKSESLYPNTNNKNNNKGNQFEDKKIDESIFDIGNTSDNNGTSTESDQGTTIEESSDAYIAQVEQAIFQIVNKERTANGLSSLTYSGTMEYYARYKSKDMGDKGYFDHHDLNGELITAKMKRDGVSYNAWGENIAYIQGSYDNVFLAATFMDNWMNSSGHRANILSSNFSSIGIGVYKVGNTYYATQEFFK
jgi:uncharacterized protein YkwD